jgi:spectinomycin phosphotransferase
MLEKPELDDAKIIDCLRDAYGLNIVEIAFLPLGADQGTAVYRAVSADETPYFVKLRRGVFDEIIVAIPRLLYDQGIRQIIAPLATLSGQLSAAVDNFNLMLYPFVEGRNGYEVALSERQWGEVGQAFKRIHATLVPPALAARIPRETYSAHWREIVKGFEAQVETARFDDPVAAELAAFLKEKQPEISRLVRRAERLSDVLQARSHEFVLCHTDIHAGNLLIDSNGSGALYVVDWDNPIFAPRERDLMFIGGGQGFAGYTADEEEMLFYRGYGRVHIDYAALAYYRAERIVQDVAAYSEQILLSDEGGADRQEGLRQLTRQFEPGAVVEMAYRSDKFLPQTFRR